MRMTRPFRLFFVFRYGPVNIYWREEGHEVWGEGHDFLNAASGRVVIFSLHFREGHNLSSSADNPTKYLNEL